MIDEKKIATVKELAKKYVQAYGTSDASSLSKILHEDWRLIPSRCSDGRVQMKTKDEVLQDLKAEILEVKDIDDSCIEARSFGQTVVVTGRRNAKIRFKGESENNHTWFTQVYVEQDDEFRCVSTHVSLIPNP